MENKQLQKAKDTIAKKYGYLNFETIPYNHISSINVRYENYQDIVNEVALEYHRLMSEWVSVDERLPESGIKVLIQTDYTEYGKEIKNTEIANVSFTEHEIPFGGPYALSGRGMLKGIYFSIPAILNPDVVKYWIPLPQPPK